MTEANTRDDRQNWAKAGYIEPEPDQGTVDDLVENAGVEQPERQPLHMRERLIARDQDRPEFDPDPGEIPD